MIFHRINITSSKDNRDNTATGSNISSYDSEDLRDAEMEEMAGEWAGC